MNKKKSFLAGLASRVPAFYISLVVLLGKLGEDYLIYGRDKEEWELVEWIHRN